MFDHDSPSELTTGLTPDPISAPGLEEPVASLSSDAAPHGAPSCPGGKGGASFSRRELLARGVVLGTAGLVTLGAVTGSARAQDKQADQSDGKVEKTVKMPTALLGKRTGVTVSRLAMGGSWGVDSEVVAVGLDQGINYLDTAEGYGPSEHNFGEFLNSIGATGHSKERKKLWIVSKTHDHHNLESRLPARLERLQQDYLDCYYMHQLSGPTLPSSPEIKAAAQKHEEGGQNPLLRLLLPRRRRRGLPECRGRQPLHRRHHVPLRLPLLQERRSQPRHRPLCESGHRPGRDEDSGRRHDPSGPHSTRSSSVG